MKGIDQILENLKSLDISPDPTRGNKCVHVQFFYSSRACIRKCMDIRKYSALALEVTDQYF